MAAEKSKHGELRGSQKILERLAKNGEVPSPAAIVEAFKFPASAKIPYWLIRGIPPAYFDWKAKLEVPISDIGSVIQSLTALNDSTINLKILINGIPYPDVAEIVIANTEGED